MSVIGGAAVLSLFIYVLVVTHGGEGFKNRNKKNSKQGFRNRVAQPSREGFVSSSFSYY
jgi:hypothetical protein